jgi:hypothetical protein
LNNSRITKREMIKPKSFAQNRESRTKKSRIQNEKLQNVNKMLWRTQWDKKFKKKNDNRIKERNFKTNNYITKIYSFIMQNFLMAMWYTDQFQTTRYRWRILRRLHAEAFEILTRILEFHADFKALYMYTRVSESW